jgi:hypothetical protein
MLSPTVPKPVGVYLAYTVGSALILYMVDLILFL